MIDAYLYLSHFRKEKIILYVGRLEFVQKRVYRVIDTWNYLEDRYPDWELVIVGDGPDRDNVENHTKALGLKHVKFEGFQQPLEYYKRASLLLLTSQFEGFPLVLPECMSFGVIPIVYDSYASVKDIIDDGDNGVVVPFNQMEYPAKEAANKVSALISDEKKLIGMSLSAYIKSQRFSINRICDEWECVFEMLMK